MAGNVGRRAAAEVVGAFLFVFIGAGSVIVDEWTGGGLGSVGIAFAHGLALAAVVAAFWTLSGGHVNPAVSFAWAAAGNMAWGMALVYWLAQLLGAIAAALLLTAVFPTDVWQQARLGTLSVDGDVTLGQGIAMEAVLTFLIVVVYFAARAGSNEREPSGAFALGAALTVSVLVGAPLTGAVINPARAFAVGLVGGVWEDFLLYLIGPMAGALVGAFVGGKLWPRREPVQGR